MKHVEKGFLARIHKSDFEGHNYVGNFSHIYACSVGKMTYIGAYSSIIRTKIGRFCSISSNVKVIAGEHPSSLWVSTHPAFYRKKNACNVSFTDMDSFEEYKYVDSEKKYYVSIGNDVWIGSNVIIMNGVTIADGAIIASGSVVTKDVNSYSVVGGVPSKEIKKRFTEEQIAFLKDHPFWLQSDSWLKEHSKDMENIDNYMYAINNAR